jgi:hypothetical protein
MLWVQATLEDPLPICTPELLNLFSVGTHIEKRKENRKRGESGNYIPHQYYWRC